MPATFTPFAALFYLFLGFFMGLGWFIASWLVGRVLR